jgi:hypothetical protein
MAVTIITMTAGPFTRPDGTPGAWSPPNRAEAPIRRRVGRDPA